jgi:hypothetical protein
MDQVSHLEDSDKLVMLELTQSGISNQIFSSEIEIKHFIFQLC